MSEHPEQNTQLTRCLNCGEIADPCACMRNKCVDCGKPVGNITFTACDQCWDKAHGRPAPQTEAGDVEKLVREIVSASCNCTDGAKNFVEAVRELVTPLTQRIAELEKDLAENETVRRLACYGQDMRFERNAAIKRAEAAEARTCNKKMLRKYGGEGRSAS